MSSREGSVSQSASKSQQSSRKVRKFKFTDLSLSYQVRKRLYEMLISFDDNVNYQFQKEQIKRALAEILQQNESQLAYVINNVYRYDVNRDGVVTYEQFSNFCLEQHFGEMAIQRLHRTNLYARGKQRLMSCSEFVTTLNYCLSFIEIHPRKEILQTIFRDADTDRDDYITYSDYFILLKQYFGSQSQSANAIKISTVEEDLKKAYGDVDKKVIKQQIFKQKIQKLKQNPKSTATTNVTRIQHKPTTLTIVPKVQTKPITVTSKIQTPVHATAKVQAPKVDIINEHKTKPNRKSQQIMILGKRISRLVYQQAKITTIDSDRNMILCSDLNAARELLTGVFKISDSRAKIIIEQAFEKQSTISYQKFIQFAIEKFMCEEVPDKIIYPIDKDKFVVEVLRNLYFVRAKPFAFLLQELFQKFNAGEEMHKPDFHEIMNIIFCFYQWPRKTGELRNKAPLSTKIENYRYRL